MLADSEKDELKYYSYRQFCEHYGTWCDDNEEDAHFSHVIAQTMEVDFAGKTFEMTDRLTGEITDIPVYKKAVSASHPLFQEFRIWDKIHNIKLIQLESKDAEGKSETNVDITSQYFGPDDYQALFNHFNNRSTVAIDDFLTFCKDRFKLDIGKKGERKTPSFYQGTFGLA